MDVRVREVAQAELELLPAGARRAFVDAFDRLESATSLPVPGRDIIALRGTRSWYRLAIGDCRGVFRYEPRERCEFLTFGFRAGFYQRFR
jgi:mRNA-degrading endonuclease RelE of RelBE toxin-antitoxin system